MSTYNVVSLDESHIPVEKTDVPKKGSAFQGQSKSFETQPFGQAYNNFPVESTAVPKKGKPWVPKDKRTTTQ